MCCDMLVIFRWLLLPRRTRFAAFVSLDIRMEATCGMWLCRFVLSSVSGILQWDVHKVQTQRPEPSEGGWSNKQMWRHRFTKATWLMWAKERICHLRLRWRCTVILRVCVGGLYIFLNMKDPTSTYIVPTLLGGKWALQQLLQHAERACTVEFHLHCQGTHLSRRWQTLSEISRFDDGLPLHVVYRCLMLEHCCI